MLVLETVVMYGSIWSAGSKIALDAVLHIFARTISLFAFVQLICSVKNYVWLSNPGCAISQ